jgi:hypothetical protein
VANPSKEFQVRVGDGIIYANKPLIGMEQTEKAAQSFIKDS